MEQLLQRYIRGKVSEEERLKVVSWLDESPDNMREFLALRKLYDISLWHTDTEQKTLHKKFIPTIRRIAIETLKIAAIFLIGIFVTNHPCTHRSASSVNFSGRDTCLAQLSLDIEIS